MHRWSLLVALLTACAGSSSPPSSGSAEASGSGSAPGSSSACPDAEIVKRGDASLAATLRYMDLLENVGQSWGGDCEVARTKFTALEPDGKRFMDTMVELKAWGEKLTPECRERAKQRWEDANAPQIEKRAPVVQAAIATILDKCQDHPGFKEAVGKGLRVMRKKKS